MAGHLLSFRQPLPASEFEDWVTEPFRKGSAAVDPGIAETESSTAADARRRSAALVVEANRKIFKREVRAELAKELESKRRKARRTLTSQLRSARRHLRHLRGEISACENQKQAVLAELATRQQDLRGFRTGVRGTSLPYPDPPNLRIAPCRTGDGLPDESAIYFLFDGPAVAYVGQAVSLCNRLRLGSHHALRATDRISYTRVPREDLNWAECYYIGILRPCRNFGRRRYTPASPDPLADDRNGELGQ